MRRHGVVAALALVVALVAAAMAANFPALTGRVVDAANILPATAKGAVETKLKALEDKSGIQFVVATVASLDGQEIEPYANALFRTWKLGEAQKNNGVLLLIAPKERKVRIEVGYGLEGTLTDALSKIIIANAIAPRFKTGDFAGGVERGVDDVITVLTTDASEWQKRPQVRVEEAANLLDYVVPLVMGALLLFIFISVVRNANRGATPAGRYVRRGGKIVFVPAGGVASAGPAASAGWIGGWSSGSSSSSGWSSGSSSGGFSGGGGSSGGGGASGDW